MEVDVALDYLGYPRSSFRQELYFIFYTCGRREFFVLAVVLGDIKRGLSRTYKVDNVNERSDDSKYSPEKTEILAIKSPSGRS